MDIRALECFVVVAEELHFRRAAARLNMTQPSLTARIQVLEQEVGAQLLMRDRRRVQITEAGRAFQRFVRRRENSQIRSLLSRAPAAWRQQKDMNA